MLILKPDASTESYVPSYNCNICSSSLLLWLWSALPLLTFSLSSASYRHGFDVIVSGNKAGHIGRGNTDSNLWSMVSETIKDFYIRDYEPDIDPSGTNAEANSDEP